MTPGTRNDEHVLVVYCPSRSGWGASAEGGANTLHPTTGNCHKPNRIQGQSTALHFDGLCEAPSTPTDEI